MTSPYVKYGFFPFTSFDCSSLTMYTYLFWVLPIFIGAWLYLLSQHFDNFITIEEVTHQSFDYIIVGAGTAGSVLANRLSANANVSVLLIEAGGVFGLLSRVPLLTTFQQKTNADWQYETTAQLFSSKGFSGNKQNLPRGKGLGGSSQINYMLHFDGIARDFQEWKEHGLRLPFEERTVSSSGREPELTGHCLAEQHVCKSEDSVGHLLPVTSIPYDYSELSMAFVDAAAILNLDNVLLAQYNTHYGVRFSAFDAYLRPAMDRPNLKILVNTRMHKINFDSNSPYSVSISPENNLSKMFNITMNGELILCAGALNTPHILMHSGIGPKQQLRRHNIPIVSDSPNIGQNLYDHLNVPLFVTLNATVSITRDKVLSLSELYAYLVNGEGTFANFGVLGYVNSADFEHSVGVFGVGAIDERALRDVANYDQETFRANFPFYHNGSQEGLVLLNSCNQPISRGNVSLTSAKTADRIKINPNYLANASDISCTTRAIRMAIKLMATEPFRKLNATIVWPRFRQCTNFASSARDFQPSDEYLECVIRTCGTTAHHPGGTCAIGKHERSPLDHAFRVRGVDRIRVVDASILPTPVSGTPHAVIVATAEHASKLFLKEKIQTVN